MADAISDANVGGKRAAAHLNVAVASDAIRTVLLYLPAPLWLNGNRERRQFDVNPVRINMCQTITRITLITC